MSFRLYPVEQHWWSFADHQAVMDVMQQLAPTRVLEFGPGSSTLALIEGGAAHIDACEDDANWALIHDERLRARYPQVVHIRRYRWAPAISIPGVDAERYDLALIDGPRETDKRLPVVQYALDRCAAVFVALDGHAGLRAYVDTLATAGPYRVEIRETGPLAGSFALIHVLDGARPC